MTKSEQVLKHFGVLGMHWGKRKSRSSVKTSSVKKTPTSNSEEHDFKESIKNKKLSSMTNAELKKFTERVNLERQYKDLTKVQMSPGKKFVVDLLTNAAKEQATIYVKKQMTKIIENRTLAAVPR